MTGFMLHPQLAADCVHVTDMDVCRVMLMNNARFPWLVMVPMRAGIRELHELADEDFSLVMQEVRRVSQAFGSFTKADKMNVAALGNMVAQLHIHVVARFVVDAAWPQPVWNSGVSGEAYTAERLAVLLNDLHEVIG